MADINDGFGAAFAPEGRALELLHNVADTRVWEGCGNGPLLAAPVDAEGRYPGASQPVDGGICEKQRNWKRTRSELAGTPGVTRRASAHARSRVPTSDRAQSRMDGCGRADRENRGRASER